ncbi:hypothetical protein LTR36_006439 [Oleoguttula mirabilis]|uniref:Uncharacterized protein n=1 Tax=Oleoguttula mirabilis TaxID=1507867 RepID=A0AAV9JV67_9PEZI|nr:hypothetical protein LTR36_006439 [Oleoguttula mirabilis]
MSTPGSAMSGTAEVDRLLQELERNLESARSSLKQQEALLGQVKVLGRDLSTAGPIFSKKGISILSRCGLDKESSNTSREALRCLANAFLLNEPSRQLFVDLGYATKAADRLKVDNRDDEFLISRILFLLTYNTQVDYEVLVNQHHLADSINQHLSQHAKFSKSGRRKSTTSPMEDMAMTETLKLMFNMTYYYPDMVSRFTPSIEPLVNLVLHHPLPSPPLQPPISYILNALLNMDLKSAEKKTPMGREAKSSPLFPYANPEQVVDRLISIFDNAIRNQPEKDLDQAAAPLCTLLRRAYELASPQIKSWMRWILLPRDKDRDKPLGHGETVSARLLRLSCSSNLPTLRENVSSLLFELSDKDANKFVKNIGYGFASGFLMSHNIQISSNAAEASSIASEGDTEGGADINPVTGQRLSAEGKGKLESEEMTEEEKEREAEKLFVLFERLKATGVMDVKNPVQQAVDEGRFEELPD